MDKEKLENELNYYTTMLMVKRLIGLGVIPKENYAEIDTIFLEKYKPVFGNLF